MTSRVEYLLGLDLGGTRLKAMAISPAGEEVARETVATDGADWAKHVRAVVLALRDRLGEPLGIGVAAPGLAARDERSIAFMPGRLPGLEGLDWTEFLGSSNPVFVLNDAHAALLGEVWRGAAQGARDALLLTLGTGVGGAILADGCLLRGHLGRAGHFGHITVNSGGAPDIVGAPGSLEDAVGNHSLALRSGGRYTETSALIADVERGDRFAGDVWSRTVRDLAAGLVSLINALDPALIVIGGGIAGAGDMLFIPLARELDRLEWRPGGERVRVVPAQLGAWAGAYGSASRVRLRFL
jgi:glucokinase